MWVAAADGGSQDGPSRHEGAPAKAKRRGGAAAAPVPMGEAEGREVLLAVLARSLPPARALSVGEAILSEFGDFAAVLAADPERLRAIPGLSDEAAGLLAALQVAAREFAEALRRNRPVLNSVDRVLSYLSIAGGADTERGLRVLFLDAEGRLMADERLSTPQGEPAAVLPVDVVRRALQLQAAGLVLAHRHRADQAMPDKDDILQTHHIHGLAEAVGIALHDHVVIAGGTPLSMRRLGLMPGMLRVG